MAFVILFAFMLNSAGSAAEVRWARLTYLFGAAEALVFAAVGWLFGREVNRERAEKAEKAASTNIAEAKAAQKEAASAQERGTALASAIRAQGSTTKKARRGAERLAGTPDDVGAPPDSLAMLTRLADDLFPSE